MSAADLADDLRHGDAGETLFGDATEYAAIGRHAEQRALYHAERGNIFVAYDEANDARWALDRTAVAITAWLATIAKQADHDRRMRLDCGSTDGEQLSLGEPRREPTPWAKHMTCACCHPDARACSRSRCSLDREHWDDGFADPGPCAGCDCECECACHEETDDDCE